ncbi:MAG: serine/threonine-protein kinase PknK [Planctomycetota bacterium]
MSPQPRFRLDRELGTGTTGRVWRGVLTQGFGPYPAGFAVAVKYLHPQLATDEQALLAFDSEAAAGAAVQHPGVVGVLARGKDERGEFLVMQLVPGRSLREALNESGALPEPLVRSIAQQIAGGLADLHARGFLHGDVKPENMRLDAEGNAVLLDLGFARSVVDAPSHMQRRAVRPGRGSIPYLSPQQAQGEAPSRESDVFALGVVLYELATGVHPFARAAVTSKATGDGWMEGSGSSGAVARVALAAPDADKLLAAIATARCEPPSRIVPQLSPFLDRVIQEALARDPERRPSASELSERLIEQESGAWWRREIEFGASARRGGTGEPDARHLMPLVGRQRELELLLARYESAAAGAGSAIWIRGDPGSGKSRLVHACASHARTREDPPLYLYGRCRELEEGRPCEPVLRLLERFLRLPRGVAPKARETAELYLLVAPRVAQTLADALDPSFEGASSQSVPVALSTWLAALGKKIPLLIFLDDVHFADEGTLEVLALLAEHLREARVLLVLGARQGGSARHPAALKSLRERLTTPANVDEIVLGPLDEEAVEDLVRHVFHHSTPRLRLAHVLWQRSRGSPGLLAEILRSLIASGGARPHADGGGLVLAITPDDLPLPRSLARAISDSYKQLPVADRTWLRRLAVVGGRIETEFLLRAFPEAKRADVDAMLLRLVRSGWLTAAGARYRFARPALREAVYRRRLTREERVRLHAAAAEALRPAPGAKVPLEDAFQRAFHLRSAGEHRALLDLLPPLLARLLRSGQPQRVHALASWGLAAVDALEKSPELGRLRITLLEAAVDAADRLGFRKDQRELLDRLTDLEFDPSADPESVGRVYLLHGRYAVSTGQYGLARGMLKNAVEMFDRSKNKVEYSEAVRRLSLVQGHVGELEAARKLARRAISTSQHDAQRALAHVALGIVDVLEDQVEDALENADRALHLLRADGTFRLPGAYSAVYMLRARIYRASGSPGRALASASRAVELARVAGERRLEAEATARLGGLLLDLDRPEDAEARLREALLLSEEIEDRRGQALARLFLGILLWEQADPEASAILRRSSDLAVEMGLNRVEAVASAIQARISREARDLAHAERASARAMDLLERYGAELGDRVVITGTRALVLRTAERAREGDALEAELRERLRRENTRIRSPLLRLRHGRASMRLLEAVLSPVGPVFPRVRVDPAHEGVQTVDGPGPS